MQHTCLTQGQSPGAALLSLGLSFRNCTLVMHGLQPEKHVGTENVQHHNPFLGLEGSGACGALPPTHPSQASTGGVWLGRWTHGPRGYSWQEDRLAEGAVLWGLRLPAMQGTGDGHILPGKGCWPGVRDHVCKSKELAGHLGHLLLQCTEGHQGLGPSERADTHRRKSPDSALDVQNDSKGEPQSVMMFLTQVK